jgi:LysM repeat protein
MIKLLIIASISFFGPQVRQDSVRTEIISGKTFVIHKVTPGETLYGISKRYGVSVDQILEHNPTADAGLEIDQMLKVPYVSRPKPKPSEGTIHKVAEKETLYSISRLYGISIEEIKLWNSLPDNSLTLGQELVIKKKNAVQTPVSVPVETKTARTLHTVAPKETLYSIARQYGISPAQLKAWNSLQTDELKIGQSLMVVQPIYNKPDSFPSTETAELPKKPIDTPATPVATIEKVPTIKISESVRDGDEVVQSGLAELIEGTEGNRKYLALHRTAPVGAILKVRNEMNNREVFVRVMGKLPDNALTDKLVIKISKSAYDRLGAIDSRFRVEVTYYK